MKLEPMSAEHAEQIYQCFLGEREAPEEGIDMVDALRAMAVMIRDLYARDQ